MYTFWKKILHSNGDELQANFADVDLQQNK